MATTFHFKEPSKTEINIELSFGISITQVRGLNPPNPKEIFTRDWASEDGVDYYVPTTRKVKSSEVVIQFYAVDDSTSTAIYKYNDFCNYLLTVENPLRYRDTLQNQQVNLLYDSNKPAWYQLYSSTNKKLVAEVTLINPTGAATYVGGDTIIPIITLTDGAVTLDFGEAYVDPGYSADDNVDGDITANVVVAGDTVDENTAGVYVITYNVSDAAGNAAVEKTRTVTVRKKLEITFQNLLNNPPVFDVNDVSQWNTFFNYPSQGQQFTSVEVNDNIVNFYGGGGSLDNAPFWITRGAPLISIKDFGGCMDGHISNSSFNGQTTLEVVELPFMVSADSYSFGSCTGLTELKLNRCASLGGSVDDNYVFDSTLGTTIALTVPSALMTNNGGNPDGDIAYLQANNSVTVTQV